MFVIVYEPLTVPDESSCVSVAVIVPVVPTGDSVGQSTEQTTVPVQDPDMLGTSSPVKVPVNAMPRQLPAAVGVNV
jgi:hypothetical protein